jgi:hypothetical protein
MNILSQLGNTGSEQELRGDEETNVESLDGQPPVDFYPQPPMPAPSNGQSMDGPTGTMQQQYEFMMAQMMGNPGMSGPEPNQGPSMNDPMGKGAMDGRWMGNGQMNPMMGNPGMSGPPSNQDPNMNGPMGGGGMDGRMMGSGGPGSMQHGPMGMSMPMNWDRMQDSTPNMPPNGNEMNVDPRYVDEMRQMMEGGWNAQMQQGFPPPPPPHIYDPNMYFPQGFLPPMDQQQQLPFFAGQNFGPPTFGGMMNPNGNNMAGPRMPK